jgi:hypothetical protein
MAPRIRDLAGYRLYWHFDTTVAMIAGNLVTAQGGGPADESVLTASLPPPYLDTPLVACVDRYYVMTAVDTCGNESAPTPVSRGRLADAGVKPNAPTLVQAHFTAPNTASVKWKQITQDVSGKDIKIERYELFRSAPIDGGYDPAAAVWGPTPLAVVYTNYYNDAAVPPLSGSEVVYYRVMGGDYCDNDSDFSSPAKLDCTFTGDVSFETPRDHQLVSGSVPTTVKVVGGTDTYVSATITYIHKTKGQQDTHTFLTPGPWTYSWNAVPHGDYTITATVNNSLGCSVTDWIEVTATAPPQTGP